LGLLLDYYWGHSIIGRINNDLILTLIL
jgi:hypothetical protein